MKTALFTLLCLFWTAGSCFGQEFRIYTKVYDETAAAGGNAPDTSVVARSLTLFHAGRVYDYMQSLGEVTIYEPMQDRFTILNTERQLSTVVHTDEIKRLMQTAGKVARERIAGIRRGREGATSSTAKMLAFQLKPEFRNDFNRGAKSLSLVSPYLRYDVKLEFVETKEYAAKYREYVDWIHQLNFALHPRVLLPGPRLALNKILAEKHALPLEVKLQVNTQPKVQLRAEHRIHWKLDRRDRFMINQWNTLLAGPSVKKVPLREYQRLMGMRTTSR